MPNPTAKPGAKHKGGNPKGGGKGKEGGSKDQPKANPGSKSKVSGGTPKPKPKPKAEAGEPTVKCLFYPNCNRGDSCPFLHEGAPKAKAESKASPAKASAKATVAALLTSTRSRGIKNQHDITGQSLEDVHVPFQGIFRINCISVVSRHSSWQNP